MLIAKGGALVICASVPSLLDYCLRRGFELRFIGLMWMGHLAGDSNGFVRQFVGMPELLALIAPHYAYQQLDAPVDATALRYEIPRLVFLA